MTLGGRCVPVGRPRMRTADDQHELPVVTYEYFADRDPLTRGGDGPDARRRLDAAIRPVGEPVGEDVEQSSSATTKSTTSETCGGNS
jgi:putative transposase